jgi:hypothetical protein
MYDIKDGKISPWLLLNSVSGKKLLASFDDVQLMAIGTTIDPQFWMQRFKKLTADVALAKQVAKESNL